MQYFSIAPKTENSPSAFKLKIFCYFWWDNINPLIPLTWLYKSDNKVNDKVLIAGVEVRHYNSL